MQRVAWRLACYQVSGRKATVTNNNPPAREQHAARDTVLCLPMEILGVRKWILTLLWQRQDRTPNQFWKHVSSLFTQMCVTFLMHFVTKNVLKTATIVFLWIEFLINVSSYYHYILLRTWCKTHTVKVMHIIIRIRIHSLLCVLWPCCPHAGQILLKFPATCKKSRSLA